MHLVGLMRKNKKMALLMPLKERQKLFDHFHTALLHFAVQFITEEEEKNSPMLLTMCFYREGEADNTRPLPPFPHCVFLGSPN